LQGEHATETELKLKIMEIYNAKLDERECRKAFVIERGLLDYRRLLSMERKRPRDEREVYEAFRPFARFNTPQEHEDLVRGIILEQRLRKRIAQLQEYRRNGIRSLAEAQEYEAARRKREQQAAMRRAGATMGATSGLGGSGVRTAEAVGSSGRRIKGTAATLAGGGGLAVSIPGASTSSAAAEGGSTPAASAMAMDDNTGDLDSILRDKKRIKGSALAKEAAANGSSNGSSGSSQSAFSVNGLPGSERLTPDERALCEKMQLIPLQYQQIKATILNLAHVRSGVRKSEAAAKLPHVSQAKIGGVFDFVVSAGWASPKVDLD
jgi:hypothetical protein